MLRAFTTLVTLAGCGRLGFDDVVGDGGVIDDARDDGGSIVVEGCAEPPVIGAFDRMVGTGTPASCTVNALQAALDLGGTIGFNCGGPMSFTLGAHLEIMRDVTLVANDEIRLVGGNSRILLVRGAGVRATLVDLFFTGGYATTSGGAIEVDQASLVVVGATFNSNRADEGGGAIFHAGPGTLEIYDSVFTSNNANVAGAIQTYGETTLVRSEFLSNNAVNVGGAIDASNGDTFRACGIAVRSNTAQGLGGGIHRVGAAGMTPATLIESSVFSNNTGSNGGGVYVQRTNATVRNTTFVTNRALDGIVGGYWQTETAGSFTGENLTVALNSATAGTGAGMNIGAAGTLEFSTIVLNTCQQPGCSGAGLKAEASLALRGVIIANNVAPQNANCAEPMLDGTASFQWPDDSSLLCAPAMTRENPTLTASDRTGPRGTFFVYTPDPGSPVIGAVSGNCPETDQLGQPRVAPCTAGSLERP